MTRRDLDDNAMNKSPESQRFAMTADRGSLLPLMLSRRIVWSATKLALVVGTVLNLINNGPQWWQQHTVTLWKVLLNYIVPFCVSSYSAARNELNRRNG